MTSTAQMLEAAVSEALETMAFMSLLPLDEELDQPQDCMLAEMHFRGPLTGTLQILTPAAFCQVLAQNVAALPEVDTAVCNDALREFCNVTCGLILRNLASVQETFDLVVPSVYPISNTPSWNDFCCLSGVEVFNADGFSIAARILIVDCHKAGGKPCE